MSLKTVDFYAPFKEQLMKEVKKQAKEYAKRRAIQLVNAGSQMAGEAMQNIKAYFKAKKPRSVQSRPSSTTGPRPGPLNQMNNPQSGGRAKGVSISSRAGPVRYLSSTSKKRKRTKSKKRKSLVAKTVKAVQRKMTKARAKNDSWNLTLLRNIGRSYTVGGGDKQLMFQLNLMSFDGGALALTGSQTFVSPPSDPLEDRHDMLSVMWNVTGLGAQRVASAAAVNSIPIKTPTLHVSKANVELTLTNGLPTSGVHQPLFVTIYRCTARKNWELYNSLAAMLAAGRAELQVPYGAIAPVSTGELRENEFDMDPRDFKWYSKFFSIAEIYSSQIQPNETQTMEMKFPVNGMINQQKIDQYTNFCYEKGHSFLLFRVEGVPTNTNPAGPVLQAQAQFNLTWTAQIKYSARAKNVANFKGNATRRYALNDF